MARDRLAAMRQQNSSPRYDQPSFPQEDYSNPHQGSYSDGNYEMQQVGNSHSSGGQLATMDGFFEEIGSIQEAIKSLNSNISEIQSLQSRQLTSLDSNASSALASQLQALQSQTSSLTNSLKSRIKLLSQSTSKLPPGNDTNVRRTQEGAIKKRFMEAIQTYQNVERESRDNARRRIERQVRIVKPDATNEEINLAVEGGGDQVFSQALMQSSRYGEARAAFTEVQNRHQDIKKIENTLTELAQLMNDLSTLINEQDDKIVQIDQQAQTVEQDLGNAEQQLQKGVKSAKAARRKRWICFWLLVLILVVAAIIAVVVVETNKK